MVSPVLPYPDAYGPPSQAVCEAGLPKSEKGAEAARAVLRLSTATPSMRGLRDTRPWLLSGGEVVGGGCLPLSSVTVMHEPHNLV